MSLMLEALEARRHAASGNAAGAATGTSPALSLEPRDDAAGSASAAGQPTPQQAGPSQPPAGTPAAATADSPAPEGPNAARGAAALETLRQAAAARHRRAAAATGWTQRFRRSRAAQSAAALVLLGSLGGGGFAVWQAQSEPPAFSAPPPPPAPGTWVEAGPVAAAPALATPATGPEAPVTADRPPPPTASTSAADAPASLPPRSVATPAAPARVAPRAPAGAATGTLADGRGPAAGRGGTDRAAASATTARPAPSATTVRPAPAPRAGAAPRPSGRTVTALPTPPTGATSPGSLGPPEADATPLRLQRVEQADTSAAAWTLLEAGRLDEALAAYRRVLERQPDNADALVGAASVLHQQGERDSAYELYRRALVQRPNQPTAVAGLMQLIAQADAATAESRLKDFIASHPNDDAPHAALGQLLARQGRWSEAQASLFQAHVLAPRRAAHAYNLAVALDRLHQVPQAVEFYQLSLSLPASAEFTPEAVRQRILQLRGGGAAVGPSPR